MKSIITNKNIHWTSPFSWKIEKNNIFEESVFLIARNRWMAFTLSISNLSLTIGWYYRLKLSANIVDQYYQLILSDLSLSVTSEVELFSDAKLAPCFFQQAVFCQQNLLFIKQH